VGALPTKLKRQVHNNCICFCRKKMIEQEHLLTSCGLVVDLYIAGPV